MLTRLTERGFSAPSVPIRLKKPRLAWIAP
jgi:hypothetical protein